MSTPQSKGVPVVGHPLFVTLVSAENVASADTVSASDPFVKVSLRTGDRSADNDCCSCCCGSGATATKNGLLRVKPGPRVPGVEDVRFPTIDDQEAFPLWQQTKYLCSSVPPGAVFLHVALYDELRR